MSYSRSLAYMLLFYLIPQLSLARTLHGEHFWQKWVQQNGTLGHFPISMNPPTKMAWKALFVGL